MALRERSLASLLYISLSLLGSCGVSIITTQTRHLKVCLTHSLGTKKQALLTLLYRYRARLGVCFICPTSAFSHSKY